MIASQDDQKVVLTAPFGSGGTVVIPGSKSISNRALMLAALSPGSTELIGLLQSDDTVVMVEALNNLGIVIKRSGERTIVHGCGGTFPNNAANLFLGNAGTAVRTLVPVLALMKGQYELSGIPRMHERPVGDLVESLMSIGANISYLGQENYLPLRVGESDQTNLSAPIQIRGDISSQFLTGLLLALPLTGQKVSIVVSGVLVSKPYVQITMDLMRSFGVEVVNQDWKEFHIDGSQGYRNPSVYEIEGDASSASYFFGAGMLGQGPVLIKNIPENSIQGDIELLTILREIGANVAWDDRGVSVSMPSDRNVKAFDLDLNHIPDAAMTLAVIALFANGPCRLRNIENWRVKETDRLSAMAAELTKLGAIVAEHKDGLEITPPKYFRKGVAIDTYDDHRMAMCFSLVCFSGVDITINDPSCVNKTFPKFFDVLSSTLQAPVITIDGPSGSGKGTVGKKVAKRLGLSYLDSGALYRAVGLAYLTDGTNFDLDNKDMVDTFLMDLKIEVTGEELFLNGQNVTLRIRDEMVSMAASQVAKSQLVRDKMYGIQRNVLSAPGLVADGRDMGTTVFPKAQLKIYLTASQQERAKRRHAQLVESGKHVKMEGLVDEMRERDAQDSSRDASPMKQAESAIEVDSTEKTIEEVVQIIVEIYQNLNGNPPL